MGIDRMKKMMQIFRAAVWETLRSFTDKWFWLAAVATVIFLWLGIGTESYIMLQSSEFPVDKRELLQNSLMSESTALSLPALAALPAAAMALTEVKTGIVRSKVFRVGRRAWRIGKLAACAVSAVLSQMMGIVAFVGILSILECRNGCIVPSAVENGVIGTMIGAHLLAAVIFACFGAAMAMLTGIGASAYVAPMAACFTMKLLGSRFFLETPYIDPTEWLSGNEFALRLLWMLLAATMCLFDLALRKDSAK